MTPLEVCDCIWPVLEDERLIFCHQDRTSELRKKGYHGRRLGPVQMTTDTAVRVTRTVVQDRGKSRMRSDIA